MGFLTIQRSALLALVGGLALAIWASRWAAGVAEAEARHAFDQVAAARIQQITDRMEAYEETLRGLQGFYAGSQEVDRDEFRRYITRLELRTRHPGVQVIGFARSVSRSGRSAFVDAVRSDRRLDAEGYPAFSIRPPGEREDYLINDYMEPLRGNEAAFGFDLFSEKERQRAAVRARDSGASASTAPLTLVQETGRQLGFLLMLPVYRNGAPISTEAERRNGFVGVVYAAFRMEDLARAVFGSDADRLDLKVADVGAVGGAGSEESPLLHLMPLAGLLTIPRFSSEKRLQFGGRQWRLRIDAVDAVDTLTAVRRTSMMVLAGGTLISFLVFALLQSLASSRARALALAERMTRDLSESEARIRAVLDNTLDAIISIDEQGLIESFNLAAEHVFGHRAEDVLGRNIKRLMPEPYAGAHDGYLRADRETGHRKIIGIGREVLGRRADGTCFPMELAITEVVVNDRRRFIWLVRDITERKRAEERLLEINRRFDLAAESAGIGVWDWDIGSNTGVWDDRMYALYGVGRDDFPRINEAWLYFVHPDDRPRLQTHLRAALRGAAPLDTELRIRVRGEVHHIKVNAVVVRNAEGRAVRMIGINYDISERKRAEQFKNEFVSTVSHELRTPLTSIRGSLGLVEAGVAGELPAGAKSLVSIAVKNCERLVGLINEILDMEKIESGKMTIQLSSHELMTLVEQAVEANQGFAVQHGTRIEILARLPDAKVGVDADRLLQVLANLLSNAAKFSPAGEVVGISLFRRGDRLRVEVVDHGPGIPDEFRTRIFEKFSQADGSTTRAKGGSGLGLSISRALVERMGGEIDFLSTPGQGSCFWFELPEIAAQLPSLPSESNVAHDVAGAAPRVLVCEDDADVAHLLSLMLVRAGYQVDCAASAAAARALLAKHDYAAMTLDIGLPDENGMDLLRELRNSDAGRRLPVVVVSGTGDPGATELGGALAVADWLEKPIDTARLLDAVRRGMAAAPSRRLRILHVEDDVDLGVVVGAQLAGLAEIVVASTLAAARAELARQHFDLVILDLGLPDGSGADLLPVIQGLAHSPTVLVFSAREIDARLQAQQAVIATLVKSRTSNERLVQIVREMTQRTALEGVAEGQKVKGEG